MFFSLLYTNMYNRRVINTQSIEESKLFFLFLIVVRIGSNLQSQKLYRYTFYLKYRKLSDVYNDERRSYIEKNIIHKGNTYIRFILQHIIILFLIEPLHDFNLCSPIIRNFSPEMYVLIIFNSQVFGVYYNYCHTDEPHDNVLSPLYSTIMNKSLK